MAHHISCLQVIDSNSMNKIIRTLKPSLRTPSKLLSCLNCGFNLDKRETIKLIKPQIEPLNPEVKPNHLYISKPELKV